MNLFSNSNSKLKKDGVYSFGLPAKKTCPNAGECRKFCYASKAFYLMPSVQKAQAARFELTRDPVEFAALAVREIKVRGIKRLRIHDSGDFYSLPYLKAWIAVMKENEQTQFYAYTKQVSMMKAAMALYGDLWPKNFRVIFSFGGKQDSLIDRDKDRHAVIFPDRAAIKAEGYADGSDSDLVALEGKSNRIGVEKH